MTATWLKTVFALRKSFFFVIIHKHHVLKSHKQERRLTKAVFFTSLWSYNSNILGNQRIIIWNIFSGYAPWASYRRTQVQNYFEVIISKIITAVIALNIADLAWSIRFLAP